jgi:hypothetical protein
MEKILEKLKKEASDCCVTIILKTHRTRPDDGQDPILLKNLIREAELRLLNGYDKRLARSLVDKMNALAETINHTYNSDGLVLFVNDHIAEYIRLPLPVENRVVIDRTFATRDLIRALHQASSYFVLVLSRDKARLIEALNDQVKEEVEQIFPIENLSLHPVDRTDAALGSRQTSLMLEFFNRVDKQLNKIVRENPLPVLLCTEESNYHQYLKIADRKEIIVGHLNGSRQNEKAHHIIEGAWPLIKQINSNNNQERLQELSGALGTGKLVTDYHDIWDAVQDGKGKTLFIKQGYFQPARLENGAIELVPHEQADQTDVVDDIIDEMIELNLKNGGDAVFLSDTGLDRFNGLALTTRY